MDEKALERHLSELFRRLGYDVEAQELSERDADLVIEKDGIRLNVQADTTDRPEAA